MARSRRTALAARLGALLLAALAASALACTADDAPPPVAPAEGDGDGHADHDGRAHSDCDAYSDGDGDRWPDLARAAASALLDVRRAEGQAHGDRGGRRACVRAHRGGRGRLLGARSARSRVKRAAVSAMAGVVPGGGGTPAWSLCRHRCVGHHDMRRQAQRRDRVLARGTGHASADGEVHGRQPRLDLLRAHRDRGRGLLGWPIPVYLEERGRRDQCRGLYLRLRQHQRSRLHYSGS